MQPKATTSPSFRMIIFSIFLLLHLISCAKKSSEQTIRIVDRRSENELSLPKVVEQYPLTHLARGNQYAIASQGNYTSMSAREILEIDGNLIDAAVAASFTISVERPQSSGLGGGGFLIFYNAKEKKSYAYDFREQAPLRAFPQMYLNNRGELIEGASQEGILASAVPGLVAGLYEIHKAHGKLDWAKLLEPAIRLAEEGFEIYPGLAKDLKDSEELLSKNAAARKIFFNKNGRPLGEGDLLVQKDLAKTLREIQKRGKDGFYRGWVASAILNEFSQNGGLIEAKDFKAYQVKTRNPIVGEFLSYKIISMPPPSSGGVHVIQILNILENKNLFETGASAPQNISFTASAMQRAFADRAQFMGDPDFVKVPVQSLTDKSYAKQIAEQIDPFQAQASEQVKHGNIPVESLETTHLSLMDADGNAIATTQTINGIFGSGIVIPGTGIIMNNEMDDFTTKLGASNMYGAVGDKANQIEPKKRPLSSMAPSIVLDPKLNRPILALGTNAGTRIISCVISVILNRFGYKMNLPDALASLRYHHQWSPDQIFVEEPGFPPEIESELLAMGHKIKEQDLRCRVQAVENEDGSLIAVSDPRAEGRAVVGP